MLDGMTNIKASEVLIEVKYYAEDLAHYSANDVAEALDMAIKALQQTDKMFFISEILVRESKREITPEKTLNQIRDILMGYTFWDKESKEKE